MSRVSLAKKIGIDSSKLINYEHGRAATPYGVAAKIAAEGNINLRWLATGEFPRLGYFEVPQEFDALIPKNVHFSKVFDRLISKNWAAVELKKDAPLNKIPGISSYWILIGGEHLIPATDRLQIFEMLIEKSKELPRPFRTKFIDAMIDAGGQFIVNNEKEIEDFKHGLKPELLKSQKLLSDYIKSALLDRKK